MKSIKFDYKLSDIKTSEIANLKQSVQRRIDQKKSDGSFQNGLNFLGLPDDQNQIGAINSLSRQIMARFKNLVVIGIGGSDLGARAALSALQSKYRNELPSDKGMKIYFTGDTTDPQPLQELLATINLKETAIQVISKSGKSVETLSNFLILRNELIKKVGLKNHSSHIVVTTSEEGVLFDLAVKFNYLTLPHPPVGGRFSVLSTVGLFSLACAGINIEKIIDGARDLKNTNQFERLNNNQAFEFAAIQHLASTKNKKNVLVMMPYIYKLADFAKWFRQIWAESLGKGGKGQTPVAALGPTDQHSQLQLYQEGPANKIFTFIVEEPTNKLTIPKLPIKNDFSYVGGWNMSEILNIEQESTAKALAQNGRPSSTITIPKLNEYYLGQLFMFFEMATVYAALLSEVNPFDQPGVELSKKILHQKLRK